MPSVDIDKIRKGCALIVDGLGLGHDEHTKFTAYRFYRALVELLHYHIIDEEPKVKLFPAKGIDDIIIVKDIPFTSLCSHHLLIFEGVVHVAYLPGQKIIGLSKIPRIVDYFSKRPQVQEKLANDIADYLMKVLEPQGVMVIVEGRHSCAACRGVRKDHTFITSAIRGVFSDQSIRQEVLMLLRR